MAWKLPDSKWLLGEIDGVDFHQERRDVYSDLRRQNSILQSGFTILRWTGSQVRTGEHIAAIRHFLASAGWQAGAIVDPELHLP
jgi:very-short-patch-repair endonuclease